MNLTPAFSPLLALAALVPVLIGPLPAEAATLTAKLCGGGAITIPLGPAPLGKGSKDSSDCHPKGCHAGACRERGKRGI